jgi:serine phosphatase RsbU (regulator of sigma subunit)
MCETSGRSASVEQEHELICSGVWGGIRDLDSDVRAEGVAASLYSSSCDGGEGGDIYYFGVCKGSMLTRVAIADVVGHGQAVREVGQYMYDALAAHICDPDGGTILLELNRLAGRRGLRAMTTAAVVTYSAAEGRLLLSNAGHPPVLLRRANERAWSAAASGHGRIGDAAPNMDLPLAVLSDAAYSQHVVPVSPGDRLFIHTDGITEDRQRAVARRRDAHRDGGPMRDYLRPTAADSASFWPHLRLIL